MTYDQVIARLFAARSTKEKSLQGMQDACKKLNSPEKSFPSIHIAGTNGKGSVATKIAKTLEFSGYKVGLFTSPHIEHFEERIQINGTCITKEEVVLRMQKIFSFEGLSFFEMATLLCFLYFCEKKVDVAVLEVGLGGRVDATNVASTILSIITSIGLDHTVELGSTLEQIAGEKAGIIKRNAPVVLGPKANYQSIMAKAKELNAPIVQSLRTSDFYDEENSLIAKEAIEVLKKSFFIKDEAMLGLNARPPCRFEEDNGVIYDVAHNPDGIMRLLQAIEMHFPNKEYRMVIGLSQDKDIKSCLELCTKAKHIYLVRADTPRAASLDELERILQDLRYGSYSKENNVKEALQNAKASSDLCVVFGSFYLMAEAKLLSS